MKKLIAPILFLLAFAAQAQDFSATERSMLTTVCGLATSNGSNALERRLIQLIDQPIRQKACTVLQDGREGNEQFVEFIARQFQTAQSSNNDDSNNATPNKDDKNQGGGGNNNADPGSSKDSKSNLKPKSQPNPDLFPKPGKHYKGYQTDTHPLLKQPERVALQEACEICKKSQKENAVMTAYENAFMDFMLEQIGDQGPQELCEFGGQKNYACYVLEAASGQDGKVGYEDFINKVVTVRNYLKSIKK